MIGVGLPINSGFVHALWIGARRATSAVWRKIMQPVLVWIRDGGRMLYVLVLAVLMLALGAQVVNEIERLIERTGHVHAITWTAQVFAALAMAAGVIVIAIGMQRHREKVPMWQFALLLLALGGQMATDARLTTREAAGRYSFQAIEAALWRVDTTTGAVDLCALRGGSFNCVRLDSGAAPHIGTAAR